jgi:hypothetical protein
MEEQIGSKQMAILYIGSGIGKNILNTISIYSYVINNFIFNHT